MRRRNCITVSSSVEIDEVEHDVEVECEVPPYRPMRGPTMNDPGSPAEGGDVESWEVYEVVGHKRVRREEWDDLFDADELLELVGDQSDWDEPDPDDARDRAMDREMDGYDRRYEREEF